MIAPEARLLSSACEARLLWMSIILETRLLSVAPEARLLSIASEVRLLWLLTLLIAPETRLLSIAPEKTTDNYIGTRLLPTQGGGGS